MKIYRDILQKSVEWHELRTRFPTASEMHNLVSPAKLHVCEGKAVDSYVARKLAERWIGQPLRGFDGNYNTDQGNVVEDDARLHYELLRKAPTEIVGMMTDDDGRIGASPDWIVPSLGIGCECKAPKEDTYVKWLLDGGLPVDHRIQVQSALFVSGYEAWDFMSECADFPTLLVRVKPDPEVTEAIREALDIFWDKFNRGWARLIERNGGREPKRRPKIETTRDEDGAVVRTLIRDDPDAIGTTLEGRYHE